MSKDNGRSIHIVDNEERYHSEIEDENKDDPEAGGKNDGDVGINLDDFKFPLPPRPAILPLNIKKKDVSTDKAHFPDIMLGPNGTPVRFPRVPPREKRPRQTIKTFEDLREYTQNRPQSQDGFDHPEHPRTLFRDPDGTRSGPQSPEAHNSDVPEYGSSRQDRGRQAMRRQSNFVPDFVNEPEAAHINENNPFQEPWRPLIQSGSSNPRLISSTNSRAQNLSNFTSPSDKTGQGAIVESQYKLNDWDSMNQRPIRPKYPELVTRGVSNHDCPLELYPDLSEPPYRHNGSPPNRRHGELELAPIRGLNITKNSQRSLTENHGTRRSSLDDTYQPPVSAQKYPADVQWPLTPPLGADLNDSDQVKLFERKELLRYPQVPENAYLNPFSSRSSVLYENDDNSYKTTSPVPRNTTSPGNQPRYPAPMWPWVGPGGYTSNAKFGDATHNASSGISFGPRSREQGVTFSNPNLPSPPASASASRHSSPDRFIDQDNSSVITIMRSTGKKSSKGWMSWAGVRDKISNGKVWHSSKGKNGQKISPDLGAATAKALSSTFSKTRKLVRRFKHKGDPNAQSTSAHPVNEETGMGNALNEEEWEEFPSFPEHTTTEAEGFPIAESSAHGARRGGAGHTVSGNNSAMGDSSIPYQPQPAEPDTAQAAPPAPPTKRASAFCGSLAILSRIWNAGIQPTFSKFKRKVVGTKTKPQSFYMKGSRENLTLAERIRFAMGLGGRHKRRAPGGGEETEGVEMTPVANAPAGPPAGSPAGSLRSTATIGRPANDFYNPRNSDEVETRELVDPVRETITERGTKGLWSSTAAKPKSSTRRGLLELVGIKSKAKNDKGKAKSSN